MKIFITLLITIVSIININGQCSIDQPSSDQNNANFNGQSFTSTCNGLLQSISFEAFSQLSPMVTVNVYDSDGCGGSLLGSTTIAQPSGPLTATFIPNIALVSGNVYTFELVGNDMSLNSYRVQTSDVYAGGDAYASCNLTPNADMLFNVQIEEVIPIPTLSQWGIIALSMIMLIFGVIAVRQRKVIFR